jgi:hypothetical protein
MENTSTIMMNQYFMKRWLALGLICHFFLLSPRVAAAAEQNDEYSPDRPGVTNGPDIQQKNSLSVEVGGVTYERDKKSRKYTSGDNLLRLGVITDMLEVRFGWAGFLSDTEASGVGDTLLGIKAKFLNQDQAQFDIGLIAEVVLNVGSDRFSAEGNDTSLLFMASRDVSDSVSYTGNYGLTFAKNGSGWQTTHCGTSQLEFSFLDSWEAFGEVFGEFGNEAKPAFSIGGGAYTLLRKNLQVDASFGAGLSDAAPDWFISVGFAIRLPK